MPIAARAALAVAVAAALWPIRDIQAQRSCDEWFADVTAVEGRVELRRAARQDWAALTTGERVCSGDTLRSEASSRATITLIDGTTLRLNEHSALGMPEPASRQGSLIELLRGVIHIISRDPRLLLFTTPYANAGLEGTEFDIHVDGAARLTEVIVLEGSVSMTTPAGQLSVPSNHIAIAKDGEAPTSMPYAAPIERMRWASYFPPVVDGTLPGADREPSAPETTSADFYARRAAARLATASIAAAEADIATALRLDPRSATALSLRALLALERANRDAARQLLAEALAAAPSSVVALLVQSHLEQSTANIRGAEQAVRQAAALEPENAIVLTRLAEIALARGDAETAIASATRARELAPAQGAPLIVLGFANLRVFEAAAAARAFAAAIELEPDAPMARLGAAQAAIQGGDSVVGRRQLELAVALDPANPLTRSYMAKVYDAENRVKLTEGQLDLAKEFDPVDPTPWLYSSLQKLRTNRPVEALQDLQAATQKNGDRPVFRSWLALDDDIATRSAGIGRIHNELGFGRLALNEAWAAISDDATNFAAHRLLAEGYSTEPKHEIARSSELYVSQLLQPVNIAPIKPQLAQQNLFIAQRAGPSHTSFDELTSPLVTNGLKLRASAVTGDNGIEGDDVALAGLHDRLSYSVGHYRFETDGFRDNNDIEQTAVNAFIQYRPTYDTNLQAELRSAEMAHGDITTFFDRDLYSDAMRVNEDSDSLRLGAKHNIAPDHTLLASLIAQDVSSTVAVPNSFAFQADQQAYRVDVQDILRLGRATVQTGLAYAEQDEVTASILLGASPVITEAVNRQLGIYSYANFTPAATLTLTAGASLDSIELDQIGNDAFNPKLGLTWRPTARTTVRASAFETLYNDLTTSRLNAQPRLEPVQVAGFTQLVLSSRGDESSVRGVSVDHELSSRLFVGWQGETRRTNGVGLDTFAGFRREVTLKGRAQEAYAFWMPFEQLSVAARYERNRQSGSPADLFGYSQLATERLPLEVRYFSRGGFTVGARASYVDQRGEFFAPPPAPTDMPLEPSPEPPAAPPTDALPPMPTTESVAPGHDEFWVVDAFVGYRLPNRRGLLSLNADNLLDERFQFQDIDPTNPSLFPERLISLRFTLAFD